MRSIAFREVDFTPLCLHAWPGLRRECAGIREYAERQTELGIDVVLPLPRLPVEMDHAREAVTTREERSPYPLLKKTFRTPAGSLDVAVEQTADWPHGNDVVVWSDFTVPRSKKLPVCTAEDIEPLEHLLSRRHSPDLERVREAARETSAVAAELGLATIAHVEGLSSAIYRFAGPEALAVWGLDDPAAMQRLVDVVAAWEARRTSFYLERGADIVSKGEWAAGAFLSPDLFRTFMMPVLKQEIARVHEAGAVYCYHGSVDMMPYLDLIREAGADVLFGVDPLEGRWDLGKTKEICGEDVALWGGMNGYLQVCRASPQETERAVEAALHTLAPGGGFILCPVDDVPLRENPAATWENLRHMARTWRAMCQPRRP